MCKNMWAGGKSKNLGESSLGYPHAPGSLTVCGLDPLLFCNLAFFSLFLCVMRMGLAFWENGCTTLPIFEACPYTWEGEIFHSLWSLEISFFFQILFLPNLEYT
jgi:hypothetical protein